MLVRVCRDMDELAAVAGVRLCADPFLFSLVADCSQPMPPGHLTRRVAILKAIWASRTSGPRPSRWKTRHSV